MAKDRRRSLRTGGGFTRSGGGFSTASAPAAWSPVTLGAHLWLRGESYAVGGAGEGTWTDLSGNGRDFTITAPNTPAVSAAALNGRPGVSFDGANDYLSRAAFLSGTTNAEWWFVARSTRANGVTNGWHDLGSNATSCLYPYQDDHVYDGVGSTTRRDAGVGTAFVRNAHIHHAIAATGAYTINVNGSAFFTGGNTCGWAATFKLGESTTPGTVFMGLLFEVVCTPILSAGDRTLLLAYLQSGWGL